MAFDHYPGAGYYGVVKTPGFGSWVIRAGTHSWANHAFVTIDDHGTIIEAEPGGVRKGYLDEYGGCKLALNLREPGTEEQRAKVAGYAGTLIGTKYNDLAIADDALNCLGIHWRILLKLAAGDHELVCSSLAALCGQQGGFNWLCGKPLSEVTPADLAERTSYMVEWTW